MFIVLIFILFSSAAYAEDANVADMQVRVSDLEEQLRYMYGKIEELEHNYSVLERKMASRPPSVPAVAVVSTPPTHTLKTVASPIPPVKKVDMYTPKKHYQVAFDHLSNREFSKARDMFAKFTKQYPNDALIGNAYYWMGETYYVERDYGNAAKMFKSGYEKMPRGNKASDNLLKLALSLEQLGQKKNACVIYEKLQSDNPPSFIASRVKKELESCE